MDIVEIRRKNLSAWFKGKTLPEKEKSYLSQLMSGKASFGEKAARRIEGTYGMDPNYLDLAFIDEDAHISSSLITSHAELSHSPDIPSFLRGKSAKAMNPILDDESDFVGITRVDFKLSAGIKGFAIEPLNGERAPIFFRKDWLAKRGYDPESLHAIEITGPSMETSLYDGDLVVVNIKENKPVDGEVFAANYEGELVVKRLVREAGKWWLSSDNHDKRRFPNKLADENCFIIGKVIHKQSERI